MATRRTPASTAAKSSTTSNSKLLVLTNGARFTDASKALNKVFVGMVPSPIKAKHPFVFAITGGKEVQLVRHSEEYVNKYLVAAA